MEQTKFKIGDKVRCCRQTSCFGYTGYVHVGDTFIVHCVLTNGNEELLGIQVIFDMLETIVVLGQVGFKAKDFLFIDSKYFEKLSDV